MKKLLVLLFVVPTLLLTGCSNSTSTSEIPKNPLSYSGPDTSSSIETPFVLTNTTLTPCPFVPNGNFIIFPNWEDNNKISLIAKPYSKSIITTSDVKDFANYSTDSLAVSNDIVYFADSSKQDQLSSFNLSDKIENSLSTKSASNIIASGNTIYYINKSDNYKLYTYDIVSQTNTVICSSKVGSYLINGDFILYQNLDDNAKIYKCKLDGSENEQITDFSVDSFVIYNNELLAINLTDNNTLYSINPTDLKATRIGLINGENLKCFGDKLYFINLGDFNHLYSLTVNLAKKIAESEDIITLSPACASFDMFPNFAVRGNKFKEIVKSLI